MSGRLRALARETEDTVARGWYVTPSGRRAEIGTAVARARAGTRVYGPEPVPEPATANTATTTTTTTATATATAATTTTTTAATTTTPSEDGAGARTVFEVTGEGSLQAARRLAELAECEEWTPDGAEKAGAARAGAAQSPVAVLNFASARNPGGGYLNGAQAQEEALCRGSALYQCLREAPGFYAAHRADRSPFYSDRVIHSPAVPVFRDDAGALLEAPFPAGFLTCPAPNAGVIARRHPTETATVPDVLHRRAGQVLRVAAATGARVLVLGAWGCGVFRNSPADVAAAFATHLRGTGPLAGAFSHVAFAVLDRKDPSPVREPFHALFGGTDTDDTDTDGAGTDGTGTDGAGTDAAGR